MLLRLFLMKLEWLKIGMDVFYLFLLAPVGLLGLNFVFGHCSVANSLDCKLGPQASTRRGKLLLALVLTAFVWQLTEYQFAFRQYAGRTVSQCNVLYFCWFAADAVSSYLMDIPALPPSHLLNELLTCTACDLVYGTACCLFLLLFFMTSTAVVQHAAAPLHAGGASHCSKCNAWVVGMDHHCYFVHNCIGHGNRYFFVGFLGAAGFLAAFLLVRCADWYLSPDAPYRVAAGALLTAVVCVGAWLMWMWQLLLIRRSTTTIAFLKRRRERKQSLIRAVKELVF